MATYDEIASQYAEKIKSAVKSSGLTKSASLITEATKRDQIINLLKELASDVKKYRSEDKPLSEANKEYLFELVGKKLGLSKPDKIYLILREASNDQFVALANYWAQFYEEIEL